MKNKNKLLILALSLLLIASCDAPDDALDGLEDSLEAARIVTDQNEQENILDLAAQFIIPSYETNKVSYSIDASLAFGVIASESSGYFDHEYDSISNKSSSSFTLTSRSETVTIQAKVENDLLNANAVAIGINALNIENQALVLPKAKLSETLKLGFLKDLDKSLISNYKVSSVRHEAMSRNNIYFFDLNKDYLNQQINNNQFVFNSDPTIGLIYEPNKLYLIGFIISGEARMANAFNVDIKLMGVDIRYLRNRR